MLARVGAAVKLTVLQLTIAHLIHSLEEQSRLVALQQWVPSPTPNHFNDVPAGTAENTLELLNNFSVATHRSVKTLQVTVHNKVQVSQAFSTCQPNGPQGLGLITFAIAHETPDLAIAMIHQAALLLILHDVRLIDRLNRSKTHGHGWKLPVVGHQPGMRV